MIGLSVVPLVVVLEVANGMIEGITRRFIEIGTYHIQVSLYDPAGLEEQAAVAGQVEDAEGVVLAFSERQGLGLIRSDADGQGVQVRAVPPDLMQRDQGFRQFFQIVSGDFDLENRRALLMGKAMASELEVKVGDEVRILTSKTVGGKPIFRISRFTVRGIFSTGYQDLDKSWVYIPLATASLILPDSRQIIGVKVESPFGNLRRVIDAVNRKLSESGRLFRTNTWYTMEENQYGSFKTTKSLLVFIMVLIVIVATVNVSSAMVMIVLEKTQEIGILKGIGASPTDVSLSFIITGFITGVLGAFMGIAVGLLISVNINQVIRGIDAFLNGSIAAFRWLAKPFGFGQPSEEVRILDPAFYLETIPIRVNWLEISGVAFLAVFLATAASLLPARQAGRVRPMDVLRKV
jgi:lipoprotein-releasing system permease protein